MIKPAQPHLSPKYSCHTKLVNSCSPKGAPALLANEDETNANQRAGNASQCAPMRNTVTKRKIEQKKRFVKENIIRKNIIIY